TLAHLLAERRSDLSITCIDVYVRPHLKMPVEAFDGWTIPFEEGRFDYALLIDVLHHTKDPEHLLREALRVCRKGLIIKDHVADSWSSHMRLKVMDWVGNAPYGVELPYHYLSSEEWTQLFEKVHVTPAFWHGQLGLYPPPFNKIFDRNLHFLSLL